MITVIFSIALYFVIAATLYASDGWFDYFDHKNEYSPDDMGVILCSLLWPVLGIFLIGSVLKRKIKERRKEFDDKRVIAAHIRIAEVKKAEAELAIIEMQLDRELKEQRRNAG